MRRSSVFSVLLVPGLAAAGDPVGVAGYYRMPDIHGDTLVFVAEGDLWTVAAGGGLADRLTRSDGDERNPRFSPDGKWIAYTAAYQGGADVYVLPATGGEPRRLTFNPEDDLVVGWTPDGRVLFRSEHGSVDTRVWTVAPQGGAPVVLPIAEAAWAAVAADGRTVAFTRFGVDWMHTSRYQGGMAPEIWVGDLTTKQYHRLTTWAGTDAYPTWHGDRLVFTSDRTGVKNLWSVKSDGTGLEQGTRFEDYDVRAPSGTGDKVVYQRGADLEVYDLAKKSATKIDIRLRTDRVWNHPVTKSPMDHLDGWGVGFKGDRLFLEARGEVASFTTADGGRRIDLTRDTPGRERAVAPSPDGRWVAAFEDTMGDERLVLIPANGLGEPTPFPETTGGWHFVPAWAPKSDALVYGDQTDTLWLVDVTTKKRTKIDHDPKREIESYTFSPDGRWVAYVRTASNGNAVVWVYDRTTGAKFAATDPDYNSYAPVWDPAGAFLYFVSQRSWDGRINGDDSSPQLALAPLGDMPELQVFWDQGARPYAIALEPGTPSPFLRESPVFATPEPAATPKKGKAAKREEPGVVVTIDPAGLLDRTFAFPVDAGNTTALAAVDGRVLYLSFDDGLRLSGTDDSNWGPGTLRAWRFADHEVSEVATDVSSFRVSGDGTTLFLNRDGVFSTLPASADTADDAKTVGTAGWTITVTPSEEWAVVFDEARRLYRDYFWSRDMVGVDWAAASRKHGQLLPRAGSRDDVGDLIGESIAELSNNHAYTWGGDRPRVADPGIGQLGADLTPDPASGFWRITHVLPGRSWSDDRQSPLAASYAEIRDGDWLFAIDGAPVRADADPASLLIGKADTSVVLTVGHTADPKLGRPVLVRTIASEYELRRGAAIAQARATVDEATGGKAGYVAIRDMGSEGLQEFADGWFAQTDKAAFIVDVRANGGGYISSLILERLNRAVVSMVRPRNQDPIREPWRSFHGPIVVLCDQQTASDGESFSDTVQSLHLGTVVGMPTWGGLVGFRYGKDLLDGGLSEPEFGYYATDGSRWLVEGPGVQPDILVDRDPTAAAAGQDPQLTKAISLVLENLAKTPPLAPPPAFPDKSLGAWRKTHPVPTVP